AEALAAEASTAAEQTDTAAEALPMAAGGSLDAAVEDSEEEAGPIDSDFFESLARGSDEVRPVGEAAASADWPSGDGLDTGRTPASGYAPEGAGNNAPAGLFAEKQPAAEAPTSFIERYASMLPEDEDPTAEPGALGGALASNPPALAARPVEPPPQQVGASHAESDDDSIEGYMAGLMQRIRGESESPRLPEPDAASPQQPLQAASERPAGVDPAPSAPPPPPPRKELLKSLDDLRGGPAPERSRDMSALRDLANQSARSAIGVAATKQNKEKAMANLVISGMAMLCGGYLAVTAPGLLTGQFVGGLAGFGWAGYWGSNTLRHMMAAGRSAAEARGKAPRGAAQGEDALPIGGPPTPPADGRGV
ncbi:MAG: hypothetical protein AAF790_08950, partial [Planctomycetota bacterium]